MSDVDAKEAAAAATADAPAAATAGADSSPKDSVKGGGGGDRGGGGGAGGGKRKKQHFKKKSPWQRKREQKRRKFEQRAERKSNNNNNNNRDGDGEGKNQFRSRKNDAMELKSYDPKGKNQHKGGFRRGDFLKDEKGWEVGNKNEKTVNVGSFAHPEMRKLFGVEVAGFVDDDSGGDDEEKEGAKEDGGGEEKEENAAEVETEADAAAEAPATAKAEPAPFAGPTPTGPKRKVALLLAFLGTNYGGMQINARTRSVQAQVELALYSSSLLARSNFGHPHKYGWSNSARTDKGVHSCAQVCSVKIALPKPDSTMDEVRELINEHLPSDIRVVDVVRVTKSFCARTQRDRVRYRYMIPSYALREKGEIRLAFEFAGCGDYQERKPVDPLNETEMEKVRDELGVAAYRIPPDRLTKFRDALAKYEGTHPYHNYTRGKSPKDPSVNRYVESFRAEDAVVDANGVEWIPTSVLGQSFLLHQIRKMIGMASEVAGGRVAPEEMDSSFSRDTVRNIHVAPASGLFLEMSYFGNYNDRQSRTESEVPPLDWASDKVNENDAIKRWAKFRRDVVEKHVMEEEDGAGNFIKYLYTMEYYFKSEGGSFNERMMGKKKDGTEKGEKDGGKGEEDDTKDDDNDSGEKRAVGKGGAIAGAEDGNGTNNR